MPDEPVNAFRLPRSETEADVITKKKKKEKKQQLPRYMYGRPDHAGRARERKGESVFLDKNLADLEQGGPW